MWLLIGTVVVLLAAAVLGALSRARRVRAGVFMVCLRLARQVRAEAGTALDAYPQLGPLVATLDRLPGVSPSAPAAGIEVELRDRIQTVLSTGETTVGAVPPGVLNRLPDLLVVCHEAIGRLGPEPADERVRYHCPACGFAGEQVRCRECGEGVYWGHVWERSGWCEGCQLETLDATCEDCGHGFELWTSDARKRRCV